MTSANWVMSTESLDSLTLNNEYSLAVVEELRLPAGSLDGP